MNNLDLIKALTRYSALDQLKNANYIPDNTNLQFEKRVLNPSAYPVLPLSNGNVATHKMAWGEGQGALGTPFYMAYPTVIQDGIRLKELDPREAYRHALEFNEYRRFASPIDAQNYASGGYKQNWGRLDGTTLQDLSKKVK